MRDSIDDIRVEVKDIHQKLNTKLSNDTIEFMKAYNMLKQEEKQQTQNNK